MTLDKFQTERVAQLAGQDRILSHHILLDRLRPTYDYHIHSPVTAAFHSYLACLDSLDRRAFEILGLDEVVDWKASATSNLTCLVLAARRAIDVVIP